jgi:transcriptional regulator with XRE-family HTH domain
LSLAKLVRALRQSEGWGQRELARRAGVSQGTVAHVEDGTSVDVRSDTLRGLATAFGMSVDDLLRGAELIETGLTEPPEAAADIFDELRGLPLDQEDSQELLNYAHYLVDRRRRAQQGSGNVSEPPRKPAPAIEEDRAGDALTKPRVPSQPPKKRRARVQDAIEDVEDTPDRASG